MIRSILCRWFGCKPIHVMNVAQTGIWQCQRCKTVTAGEWAREPIRPSKFWVPTPDRGVVDPNGYDKRVRCWDPAQGESWQVSSLTGGKAV
jgi:hypothetical protein